MCFYKRRSRWCLCLILGNISLEKVLSTEGVSSAFEIKQYDQPSSKSALAEYDFSTDLYKENAILDGMTPEEFYGYAALQNGMLNILPLNEQGFLGEGITMGVFDAGFTNVDSMIVFNHIRDNARFIGLF